MSANTPIGGSGDGAIYIRGEYVYSDEFVTSDDPTEPGSDDERYPTVINPPPDEAVIEVVINVDPLTAEQQVIVREFISGISKITDAVEALNDNSRIVMNNGSNVTGLELKQILAKVDFVINPKDFDGYANRSQRGEAAWNGGNPQISFNIDTIGSYRSLGDAGITYLILREVGHFTAANRAIYSQPLPAVQEMANDIARAVAHSASLPLQPPSNTISYGTEHPLVFESPSSNGQGWGDHDNDEPLFYEFHHS